MELMSSLLLCVLVALLPQTSGKSRTKLDPITDIKFNNTIVIQEQPRLRKQQLLLNINGPPLVNNTTHAHRALNDVGNCQRCHKCMERAMKDKSQIHMINRRPVSELLQEDVLTNEISYRTKRNMPATDQTPESPGTPEAVAVAKSTKKKTRKQKPNKTVTVTKYNMDGEVYALRVKETQTSDANDTPSTETCQVYNVKKSYPCDSPESDSLLAAARRKANKRKAKKHEKTKTVPTSTTARVQTSVFRKREVDNSQVPENFMPSIEELY